MDKRPHHIKNKILEASADFKIPEARSESSSWDLLQESIRKREKGNQILLGNMLKYVAAASVAILFVVSLALLHVREVRTSNGEILLVELPDNSTVTLNASSQISYNPFLWHFNREISLSGEAFFDVKKGSEFKVWSGDKNVTVLGTSFNIRARDNSYQVSCFTGKVLVKNDINREVILAPGEKTIDMGDQLPKISFKASKTATWRTGDFYFESTSINDVIRELERQFDIEVIFNPEYDRIYTGYFNTQSMEEALELICAPMGYTYSINSNIVTIESL